MARRGHRFVRYADDANIFVRSERAGKHVKTSIRGFLEKRMRLRLTRRKVAEPEKVHFVWFAKPF